jgi:hypothetical protein
MPIAIQQFFRLGLDLGEESFQVWLDLPGVSALVDRYNKPLRIFERIAYLKRISFQTIFPLVLVVNPCIPCGYTEGNYQAWSGESLRLASRLKEPPLNKPPQQKIQDTRSAPFPVAGPGGGSAPFAKRRIGRFRGCLER